MELQRPSSLTDEQTSLRAAARGVAGWTTIAALLLLYFGYVQYRGIPEDSVAPQRQGWWLFLYGLRIGGILLALSAVACWSGLSPALRIDAIASGATGLALVASGALIYTDNSTQAFLNVLFGALFAHGGYRSWCEYNALAAAPRPARGGGGSGARGSPGACGAGG